MNAFRQKLFLNRNGILKSMALSTTLVSVNSANTVALCEGKDDEDVLSKIKSTVSSSISSIDLNIDMDKLGQTVGNKVQDVIATGVPTQVSYGFVCGFSSGYALRKVGKVASVVFGLGFATLQTLAYAGYIEVNHTKLKEDVEKVLDANRDGKVDAKDADYALDNIMEILQYNMVGGSGFVAGFLGGFRSG